jgi:hypothetical protein
MPHVIGKWDAEVVVKPLAGGQKLGLIAEMPFADDRGGVARALENLSDGDFGGVESFLVARSENPTAHLVLVQVDATGVAAGHQGRAGGSADAAAGIVAGELPTLTGHAIEVWGAVFLRTEGANIVVPQIIAVDDDEVWLGGGRGFRCENYQGQRGDEKQGDSHLRVIKHSDGWKRKFIAAR